MIVIHLTTGDRYCDILKHKATAPRFRRKNFTGLTVRDAVLEIVRIRFSGIPDVRATREVYYPGDMGLFVYTNLMAYLKESKAAPVRKVSDREKYLSKLKPALA